MHRRRFLFPHLFPTQAELMPNVEAWDEAGVIDKSVLRRAYEAGVYSPHWPANQGGTPPEGGFDSFMDLIWIDELMRCGASGVVQCFGIRDMALPPLANLGTQDTTLTERVVREVVTGKKMIALCISEPTAGSDVASMQARQHQCVTTALVVGNSDTHSQCAS